MGECINKQVLLNKLRDELCKLAMPHEVKDRIEETLTRFAYSFAIIMVEEENCVDAVEVVRCKNCKYKASTEDDLYCRNRKGLTVIHADDYCCYGEREEN